jgi:Tfp pilus assembly protein PilN
MIQLFRKQRAPSSMLGLSLDGNRLEGVVLRRSNGHLQVLQSFAASLALDPLTADAELVGREIRNHLDAAGIRERRCAVCVPLSWALTLHTKVPPLSEEDLGSFLQIEAERGFPYGHETLFIASSRYGAPGGDQHATQVAIPRNHLLVLEKALKAAQLRPLSFSLGIAALQGADQDSSQGVLALVIGEHSVDLQVTCGRGIAGLRSLDGVFESEGVQKRLSADLLLREIRITLGQLSPEFRDAVRRVRVYGRGDVVRRFANDISPRVESMGLKVEVAETCSAEDFGNVLPRETAVSPALALAARRLTRAASSYEFLPPKTRPWAQFTTRFSSRKLVWAGASAAAVLLLLGGAFFFQQWQLSGLQARWADLEPKVKELEALQLQIKKFRPWYDDSFRNLSILRRVTEAFPEDGVVSAKTLEIRERSSVTCSGVARDNQAFLKMLDQLRATREVVDLKVDSVRGKTPLQFTVNFHWGEAGQ